MQTQTKTSRTANALMRRNPHKSNAYPKRLSARAERRAARIEARIEATTDRINAPKQPPQMVRCIPVFDTRQRCLGFVEIAA